MSQLLNHVRTVQETATPVVGMGATEVLYSDRHAFTIIEVSKSGKTFKMQRDNARRTDKNGMSDAQAWEFERNPAGDVVTVRLTKRGWRATGSKVLVGVRDEYYDFGF